MSPSRHFFASAHPPEPGDDDVLFWQEVAAMLHLGRSVFFACRKAGDLPRELPRLGRYPRWRRGDVKAFIRGDSGRIARPRRASTVTAFEQPRAPRRPAGDPDGPVDHATASEGAGGHHTAKVATS